MTTKYIVFNKSNQNIFTKKVTWSVSVCLCIPKDLANYKTKMFLLYILASQVLERFLTNLGEGTTILPREITTRKNDLQFFLFLLVISKQKLREEGEGCP